MKKKYDVIYSIGSDCACALYMRNHALRKASGPLDWVTHCNFKIHTDLILSGFEGYMEKENIIPAIQNGAALGNEKCDCYENKLNGVYFFHDFLKDVPFEESFPAVKEKYERRIKKFNKNIKEGKKVLLIWFTHDYKTSDEEICGQCKKICEKFNREIDFLIIEHDETKVNDEIESRQINDNITRYSLYTKDESYGAYKVLGNTRLVDKIFDNYCLEADLKESLIAKKTAVKIKFKNALKNAFSVKNHTENGVKKHKVLILMGLKIPLKF